MKVRVKRGMKGFIYGKLRGETKRGMDEFILKPVEHSTKTDTKGNPSIITTEQQFSPVWMERVDGEPVSDEPKKPSEMKAPELKEACKKAGIDYEGMEKAIEALEALEKSSNSG